MYPISDAFKEMLGPNGVNRTVVWYGSMTTEAGTVYDIDTALLSSGSGILESNINLPFVGGAYSTSLQMQLNLRDVDPQTLKNAKIELYVRLSVQLPAVRTWEAMSKYSWDDLKTITWGGDETSVYSDIPMGVFYVTNADRVLYSIKLEAYDGMLKFNADLPAMDTTSRSVYNWLRWACTACGVELGMTAKQVKAMPNGSRSFVYADVTDAVDKYRDLIGQLAAVLAAVAVMDRWGRLVLIHVGDKAVAEVTPSDRFSSEYEDTQSRYTGLQAQYKAQAMQEYYNNVVDIEQADDGHVINLGANPFLQISNSSARTTAIQTIIDAFADKPFTPFEAQIPGHPEYDLLDVLSFTGGHAPENCTAPITGITRTINGGVSIRCAAPDEQVGPVRESIQVDGLSGGTGTSYASSDFWIQIASFPEKEATITEDTVTTQLTVNCTVDNTTMQIAWTGFYVLDAAATVTARVLVDDTEIYSVSDDQAAGNHVLNVTTGHKTDKQGQHVIKVMLQEVAKE